MHDDAERHRNLTTSKRDLGQFLVLKEQAHRLGVLQQPDFQRQNQQVKMFNLDLGPESCRQLLVQDGVEMKMDLQTARYSLNYNYTIGICSESKRNN